MGPESKKKLARVAVAAVVVIAGAGFGYRKWKASRPPPETTRVGLRVSLGRQVATLDQATERYAVPLEKSLQSHPEVVGVETRIHADGLELISEATVSDTQLRQWIDVAAKEVTKTPGVVAEPFIVRAEGPVLFYAFFGAPPPKKGELPQLWAGHDEVTRQAMKALNLADATKPPPAKIRSYRWCWQSEPGYLYRPIPTRMREGGAVLEELFTQAPSPVDDPQKFVDTKWNEHSWAFFGTTEVREYSLSCQALVNGNPRSVLRIEADTRAGAAKIDKWVREHFELLPADVDATSPGPTLSGPSQELKLFVLPMLPDARVVAEAVPLPGMEGGPVRLVRAAKKLAGPGVAWVVMDPLHATHDWQGALQVEVGVKAEPANNANGNLLKAVASEPGVVLRRAHGAVAIDVLGGEPDAHDRSAQALKFRIAPPKAVTWTSGGALPEYLQLQMDLDPARAGKHPLPNLDAVAPRLLALTRGFRITQVGKAPVLARELDPAVLGQLPLTAEVTVADIALLRMAPAVTTAFRRDGQRATRFLVFNAGDLLKTIQKAPFEAGVTAAPKWRPEFDGLYFERDSRTSSF